MSTMTFDFARRAGVLFALLLALAVTAAPARAFEIKEVTSEKGITAWLVEDHTIPLVTMKFSFSGGAAHDPQDRQGLAYLLSGMLDEGAGDLDSQAFQSRLDELAAKLSFDAELDEFKGTLQTLTEYRDEAFELLELALTAPRFDADPLERMRSQTILSRQEDEQDPEKIAFEAWMKAIVPNHPYQYRSKGHVEDLKKIAAEELHDLTRRLFAREGLLIAVVGDITAEQLKPLLDQTFGSLPEKSGMPQLPEAELSRGPVLQIVDRDIPQSVIRFGHSAIKRDDPDFIAAYIMNHILGGGGFGSRLTEEVREKRGLTYSVYSALYPLERAGLFFGGAATVNERAGETIDVIRAELKRMAEEGPTAEELAEAKTYLTGSYPLRFDSNRKTAEQLLSIQREELGIDYVEKRNDLIEATTLEDVRRMAKQIIDSDGLVITIVGRPKGVKPAGTSG